MLKDIFALCICFGIGAGCKFFSIPLPAPSHVFGVLMIVAIWLGYKIV